MDTHARILIADDDDDIRLALNLLLTSAGYQVLEASEPKQVILQAQRQKPDLVLLDMNFSRDTTSGQEGLELLTQLVANQLPVILITAWGSIELAVEGLKQGAGDFIEKPWQKERLLQSIEQQLTFSQLQREHAGYRQLLSAPVTAPQLDEDWVCLSPAMAQIEALVQQVGPTDANILILGENGTGKSRLAKRIHQLSTRRDQPLISVNMAAIPDNLFESELFGHQKGAFTDAKQNRVGRFQLAEAGTLFFDEIGSLPIHLQPKLLRVLETGEYEVLGSSQTQRANVRLISATNANLNALLADGQFRQDLLYRLNTLVITLPSLKARLEDLPKLAEQLIAQVSSKYGKPELSLTEAALDKLRHHDWPGNIRELGHVIERAVLLAKGPEITEQELLLESSDTKGSIPLQPLEQAERSLVEQAMAVAGGNVIEAAKILDISRNALYRRLEKFGIGHVQ